MVKAQGRLNYFSNIDEASINYFNLKFNNQLIHLTNKKTRFPYISYFIKYKNMYITLIKKSKRAKWH